MAAVMKRGSRCISKTESTRICYRLDMKKERKSVVKDVSTAFGLSSWAVDGDQCDRSRHWLVSGGQSGTCQFAMCLRWPSAESSKQLAVEGWNSGRRCKVKI